MAKNPDFGAVFTYFLPEGFTSATAARKKKEKELEKANKDIPFPGWDALEAEKEEEKPQVFLVVKDQTGKIVNKVKGKSGKGMHRTAWNLRYQPKDNIKVGGKSQGNRWFRGFMAPPGTYTVTLVQQLGGEITELAAAQSFEVVPLREGTLKGKSIVEIDAFRKQVEDLSNSVSATAHVLETSTNRVQAMQTALARSNTSSVELYKQLHQAKLDLKALNKEMNGNEAKEEIGERNNPTVRSRMWLGYRALNNTYGPTPTHEKQIAIAKKQLMGIQDKLRAISETRLPQMEAALTKLGAPWIEGATLPKE